MFQNIKVQSRQACYLPCFINRNIHICTPRREQLTVKVERNEICIQNTREGYMSYRKHFLEQSACDCRCFLVCGGLSQATPTKWRWTTSAPLWLRRKVGKYKSMNQRMQKRDPIREKKWRGKIFSCFGETWQTQTGRKRQEMSNGKLSDTQAHLTDTRGHLHFVTGSDAAGITNPPWDNTY